MTLNQGGVVTGGNTYRCRTTLPPDDHKDVQIKAGLKAVNNSLQVLVEMAAGGKLVKGTSGLAFAVSFTANGMVQPPQALAWNAAQKAYVGTIAGNIAGESVRRLTIVGRAGKLEGRRTLDVG
jgi:hypothetical protein